MESNCRIAVVYVNRTSLILTKGVLSQLPHSVSEEMPVTREHPNVETSKYRCPKKIVPFFYFFF
jgi:hypothetical protein